MYWRAVEQDVYALFLAIHLQFSKDIRNLFLIKGLKENTTCLWGWIEKVDSGNRMFVLRLEHKVLHQFSFQFWYL